VMTVKLFAKQKPTERHWYAYDVVFDGETIVSNSRDPEHDLARALLARGIKGMVDVLDGGTGKPRSRVNIEKAAKCCLGSNLERYKWKSSEASDSSPHTGENAQPGRGVPAKGFDPTCWAVESGCPQKNCPTVPTDHGPSRREAA
jgi:hypothetical protein